MNRSKYLAVAVGIFGTASFAAADLIVTNGGFELGSGISSDSWIQFAGGAPGTVSERSTLMPNSGSFSQRVVAIGAAGLGAAAGVNQNSIAEGGFASLQELTIATASFDAKVDLGPGGVGFYELKILNGTGAVVATSGIQNMMPSSTYVHYNLAANVPAFGAAPNDVYAAFIEILVVAGAFDGSTASGFIDDVQVNGTLVPAPASFAFAGALGLAGLRRRRN
jgi:hypothetical protein